MTTVFDEARFRELPIVGILRFFPREQVRHLIPAVLAGGLRNIEITMNTAGAEDLIRLARDLMDGQGNVGAGTVLTLGQLDSALAAGASFIVTPAVVPEVIRACVERGVPVMPGALTPTEIFTDRKSVV